MEKIDFESAKRNVLADFIKEVPLQSEIIELYNNWAERNHCDLVYPNDEEFVDMFLSEMSPYEILLAGKNYDAQAEFIYQDLETTFSYWDDYDSPIGLGELVDEVEKNGSDYDDNEIIVEGFVDVMGKAGFDSRDVRKFLDEEFDGSLTNDSWDKIAKDIEKFIK